MIKGGLFEGSRGDRRGIDGEAGGRMMSIILVTGQNHG